MQSPAEKQKVLIFILTYNAARHIESVLDRIPDHYWDDRAYDVEVLIIDDASQDQTSSIAIAHAQQKKLPLLVLSNPVNQGYGGNQKIGYTYAVEQQFDIVVMLHGDGQYPPERLDDLVRPLARGQAHAVFGSRMLTKKDALKGGMPFYKFVGNIVLTRLQNLLLGSRLSEFHTGYRAYRVDALKKIPFQYNSGDFDFDTDIIIQLLDSRMTIREVAIPTHYGNEICHVNGLRYMWQIVRSTLLSRAQRFGIYYTPKFDYAHDRPYDSKVAFDSSHLFAIEQVKPGSAVLDFGCGEGHIAKKLAEKSCAVYGFDHYQSKEAAAICREVRVVDLDRFDFANLPAADSVLLLDIVEHLVNPELFLSRLRESLAGKRPEIILTTANVAFIIVRLSLLIGQFNYGKRGILDITHKRLFTFGTLLRMLKAEGYEILKVEGVPVPMPLFLGDNAAARAMLKINRFLISISRGMFSFQIAVVARPLPTLDELLHHARESGKKELKKILGKSS